MVKVSISVSGFSDSTSLGSDPPTALHLPNQLIFKLYTDNASPRRYPFYGPLLVYDTRMVKACLQCMKRINLGVLELRRASDMLVLIDYEKVILRHMFEINPSHMLTPSRSKM